jgi:HlyD family secretion protein
MHRNYFFIVLTLMVLSLFLIGIFFFGQKTTKETQENVSEVHMPFANYINGVGIVEPASGNIYIGIPFNRIVKKINVAVNDKVKKGDVLLQLDHQDLIANLRVKQREYEKVLANLHKLEALPRQEDLTIAEEALKKAQVTLNESKAQYEMVINLPNPRAISKEEYDKRLYRYQQAEAEVRETQAQFEKIKSGAWEPELEIVDYEVKQAKADVEAIEIEIQRTSIKSPIDGTVLQIKIHEGETTSSDLSKTAIVLGNVNELYLRVSIDQFNVSTLQPKAPAVAFRQGDRSTEYPLEFIHVEPFMVPKKYLTNETDEKVDTKVFEILYRIAKKDAHLYIGEQMNVFINIEKK